MTKRHKNKGNGTSSMMNDKFWNKETKKAIYTLKQRSIEMGTILNSCPDDIVELQAMFNYAGANKANKKRIKKIQKQLDKSGVDKQEFRSNGKYHKGSGFKDGNSYKNNDNNNNSKQIKKRKPEVDRIQCMNCLKWGSHTAKKCYAPKASIAHYADDSLKGGKSSRQVRVDDQSEEEEEYKNDAMYTDGFVKKR
jgi:hypothetical protein